MPLTRREVDDTAGMEIRMHRDLGHHLTEAEKDAIRKKHEHLAKKVVADAEKRRHS